jgi:hypothetical protein
MCRAKPVPIEVIPTNGFVEKVVARSAERDEAISRCLTNNDWRLLRFARNDTVGAYSTVPNAGIRHASRGQRGKSRGIKCVLIEIAEYDGALREH